MWVNFSPEQHMSHFMPVLPSFTSAPGSAPLPRHLRYAAKQLKFGAEIVGVSGEGLGFHGYLVFFLSYRVIGMCKHFRSRRGMKHIDRSFSRV